MVPETDDALFVVNAMTRRELCIRPYSGNLVALLWLLWWLQLRLLWLLHCGGGSGNCRGSGSGRGGGGGGNRALGRRRGGRGPTELRLGNVSNAVRRVRVRARAVVPRLIANLARIRRFLLVLVGIPRPAACPPR
jgi:hypothetical protein